MPKPNALQSLINGTKLGHRPQEVLTPPWLTMNLIIEWGGIACDASADAGHHVPADEHWTGPIVGGVDGLSLPWPWRTFCNPEFSDGKPWLLHFAKQELAALLYPARAHRKWYRFAESQCTAVIEFDPFAFVGNKDKFPAPLVLMCRGWHPTDALWEPHGDVRTIHPHATGARHAP